jgi:menaquinone-specific isochorismate synthase
MSAVAEVEGALSQARLLSCVTRRLNEDETAALNLLDFAGDDGLLFVRDYVGLAARGVALRIPMPKGTASTGHVRRILSAITTTDEMRRAGSGPVAFGALPFVPGESGSLIIPSVTVAKSSDGTGWITQVFPTDSVSPGSSVASGSPESTGSPESPESSGSAVPLPEPELVAHRVPAWSPHGFDLTSSVSHETWCKIIAEAVQKIRDEEPAADGLRKVVLARSVDVIATNDLVVGDILARLQALFPSCMVFSIEGFIGASPELLVARKGSQVRAHPLAGTIARSGDPETDAKLAAQLLASTKDRWEHELVIDAIAAVLRPLCDELDVPKTPHVLPLRNVSHLGTMITGSLLPEQVSNRTAPTALEFAAALNPTPAVGGTPTDVALATIASLEPEARGQYAGPVGWVDAAGNGEWAVGLRSARIEGNRARMFAGGGIVNDSDPQDELQETQLKLQALLAAVVRP